MIIKKINQFREAYNQGYLDSLRDNAYLLTIVLLSLCAEIKFQSENQKRDILNSVIAVLYEFNNEFKKLKIKVTEIEEIFDSYSENLLELACKSYLDVYTPRGESYKVLKNEYKLTDFQISNIGKEYKKQLEKILFSFYEKNKSYFDEEQLVNHTEKIISKL